MKPIWNFRLLALLIFVFVGGVSVLNLVADFLRPAPPPLPSRTSPAPSSDWITSARWASTIAPFRPDLRADYAMALADLTFKSDPKARSDDAAQIAAKSALKIGPHDSRVWLVLALLQARSNLSDPLIAESLKMSYLTGPNRAELVATRLNIVTLGNALNDTDLNELARGDIRLILTKFPDRRQTLVDDYVRGSPSGKKFLEESIQIYDSELAASLRSAK